MASRGQTLTPSEISVEPDDGAFKASATARSHTGTAQGSQPALARLVEPWSVDSFLAKHWEKEPLLLPGADTETHSDLLSLADVDRILSTSGWNSSDVALVAHAKPISVTDVTTGARAGVVLDEIYGRYRRGATIYLTFLNERWPPLADLCRRLAGELSAEVHANAYLTPPGGNLGRGVHHDTHDVFILQTYGRKRWLLFPSQVELPIMPQLYTRRDPPEPPVAELELNAGDVLYLPRGVPHAAVSQGTASLHVTLGVQPVLWADVIRDAVEEALLADPEFRRGLPPGFANDPTVAAVVESKTKSVLDRLHHAFSAEAVLASAVARAWHGRPPELAGHLLDLERGRSLTVGTALRRRPDVYWRLFIDEAHAALGFHGKVVRFPRHVEKALRYLAESDEEVFGERIPGDLDESGRLQIVRVLLREGFLTYPPDGPAAHVPHEDGRSS